MLARADEHHYFLVAPAVLTILTGMDEFRRATGADSGALRRSRLNSSSCS